MLEVRHENGKSLVKIDGNIIEILSDISAITDALLSSGVNKAMILTAVELAISTVEGRKSSERTN